MLVEVTDDGEVELVHPHPLADEIEARRLYEELTGQAWTRETYEATKAEAVERIRQRRQREGVRFQSGRGVLGAAAGSKRPEPGLSGRPSPGDDDVPRPGIHPADSCNRRG